MDSLQKALSQQAAVKRLAFRLHRQSWEPLMWGKFKDLVDELQATMDKNLAEFQKTMANLNQQLDILRSAKTIFIQELNEATSSLNADREELAEKQEELRVYIKIYNNEMKKCAKRIRWIFFQ